MMTNTVELHQVLNIKCDRSYDHAIVMGLDTKRTEGYFVAMVDSIHRAWNAEVAPQVAK